MRIKLSELKKIIVEVIKSSNIEQQYPKIVAASQAEPTNSMFSLNDILNAKNPISELELFAVYDIIRTNGPDIDAKLLKRDLRKIRMITKKLGFNSIIDAYEADKLFDILNDLGMFGHKSDKHRYDGDKFY